MNIVLLGYMGSGKSFIGKQLASVLKYPFIDLDAYIEKKTKSTVSEIFNSKGEIYFRKLEHNYLKQVLLGAEKQVVALGGGTPCYANNMDVLNKDEKVISIYLQLNVPQLTQRLLNEKNKRPLIAHITTKNELQEFIGKHLFERANYYNQAQLTILANNTPENIINTIISNLF